MQHEHSRETKLPLPPTQGAGVTLIQAREQKQLSPGDVASQLNLRTDTVIALEQEDFQSLPEETFVRGYYRAYAKLVGVDQESLIAVYKTGRGMDQADGPPPPRGPVQIAPEQRATTHSRHYGKLIVMMTLIAAGGVYLATKVMVSDAPVPRPLQAPGEPVQAAVPEQTEPSVPSHSPASDPQGLSDRPVENQGQLPDIHSVPTGPDQPTREIETVPPETMAIAGAGQDVLILKATAQSWAEVTDMEGNRYFYGLLQAGDTRVIEAQGPFAIVIGDFRHINLSFNEQAIDLARRARANRTVRLTLGTPEPIE